MNASRKILLYSALFCSLISGAFAQQKYTVLYVNVNPPGTNTSINTNCSGSLAAMTTNLQSGAPSSVTYNYGGSVDTLSQADSYAKSHPTEQVVTVIHGVFDSTGTTFQGKVADTSGEIRTSNLPKTGNNTYEYCGMNGDNKKIDANNVGDSLVNKNGGSYTHLIDSSSKKLDTPDVDDDGTTADDDDDDSGDDDGGDSGADSGTSNNGSDYTGHFDGSGYFGSGTGGDWGSGDYFC